MPKICYIPKRFHGPSLAIVDAANDIIAEYKQKGFSLTLRQLYYQFVARALIPNTQKEYSRLGTIISDARMAGLIDWLSIEDRTRNLAKNSTWNSPSDIIDACAASYRTPMWKDQDTHIEVWVEKEALASVVQKACNPLDVGYFCCRGYTSQSEMWMASQRLVSYAKFFDKKKVVILHLGDHDPSGLDMTRDIKERLGIFFEHENVHPPVVKRIALNMDQIRQYNPPPNPAKATDSRFLDYQSLYGDDSWELDSMDPTLIVDLVDREVRAFIDADLWGLAEDNQAREKTLLRQVAIHWSAVSNLAEELEEVE